MDSPLWPSWPAADVVVWVGRYSAGWVLASALVALAGGWLGLSMHARARAARDRLQRSTCQLISIGSLAVSVWVMHFTGMMSLDLCRSGGFSAWVTLGSALPIIATSTGALLLLDQGNGRWRPPLLAGTCLGLGLGLMHYSGMAALTAPPLQRLAVGTVALSAVLAVGLCCLALSVYTGALAPRWVAAPQRPAVGGLSLGVAVTAVHYVGMSAVTFWGPTSGPDADGRPALGLLLAGAGLVLLLVLSALVVLLRGMAGEARIRQARSAALFRTAPDPLLVCEDRDVITEANPAALALLGVTGVDGLSLSALGLDLPMLERLADRDPASTELALRLPDGGQVPVRLAVGRARLRQDKATVFLLFITDLRERVRVAQALEEARAIQASYLDNHPGIALRYESKTRRIVLLNDGIERVACRTRREVLRFNHHLRFIIDFRHIDRVYRTIDQGLALEGEYQVEYPIVLPGRSNAWMRETGRLAGDDSGLVDAVIVDVTETATRAAELEGYARAINGALINITFDLQGRILAANDHACAVLGYEASVLLGREHAALCPTDPDSQAADRRLWVQLALGEHAEGSFVRIGQGGVVRHLQGSYHPILDADGRPLRVLHIAVDVTDRVQMEHDLRVAKQHAEQAAKSKGAFLTNMSHELRTPMNSIMGFTELLLDEPLADTHRRHLETVKHSAQTLLSLLNDILDTAKLDHGAMQLERVSFSLRQLCGQVVTSMRVNAEGKGLELLLDYPEGTPGDFVGDSLRLTQVLNNLVGNAIKFTERGHVRLGVRHDGEGLHIAIADTGIGIAPDRVARIFDAFAQADVSTTRRYGGTGLGTTIARQLVELMGGRIEVQSEEGRGSTFTVHVHLPVSQAPSHPKPTLPKVRIPQLRILAVDDVPQNLQLLGIALRKSGHTLITATDGHEALDRYDTEPPFDVVLMDVQMPGMDGLEATRQIRRRERERAAPRLPIIALSAGVQTEDQQAAREAGMDMFVHKPVHIHKLNLALAELLALPVTTEAA